LRLIVTRGNAFHAEKLLSGAHLITIGRPRTSDVFLPNLQQIEMAKIREALETTRGNITKAAKLLAYRSRQTMLTKMDGYGIARDFGDLGA